MTRCPKCGAENAIVNLCGCDPNNLPTRAEPKNEKWTIDACLDANGFSTLRVSDGSEHGDTDRQPIATVYDEENAARIVAAVNLHVPNVATTAMFLMEGMKDAEDRNKAQGSSRSSYLENHGYIETVSELAAYAEFSERLVLALPEQDYGWPGVYDYEVSSEFGDWWFTHVLENGEPPTTAEGQAEFKRRFDEFFAQGQK